MRIFNFIASVFTFLFSGLIPTQAMAAEIEAEVVDLRPISPLCLSIEVTGPIQSGDSDKLQAAIDQHVVLEMRDISITFDSPGGSLYEGMWMAGILRDVTSIVSADVGNDNSVLAECASACVVAYMGADLLWGDPDLPLNCRHRADTRMAIRTCLYPIALGDTFCRKTTNRTMET